MERLDSLEPEVRLEREVSREKLDLMGCLDRLGHLDPPVKTEFLEVLVLRENLEPLQLLLRIC